MAQINISVPMTVISTIAASVENISSSVYFQVTFINPAIERRSKLQRQRRIFPKEKGNNLKMLFLELLVLTLTCMSCTVSIFWIFFYLFFFTGKHFLRAAQMNMNFATWGRLMMSILPPCSSLEPMSPPLAGPIPASTSSSTSPAG